MLAVTTVRSMAIASPRAARSRPIAAPMRARPTERGGCVSRRPDASVTSRAKHPHRLQLVSESSAQRGCVRVRGVPTDTDDDTRTGLQEDAIPPWWSQPNLGLVAVWVLFSVYAFKLAPNAASVTDRTLLEAAINLGVGEDGVLINRVFFALFNLMGVWGSVYACLLLPTGRSANRVPAWPFVAAAFFLGTFALLPYFAIWQPTAPPTQQQQQQSGKGEGEAKRKSTVTRVLESRANAALLAAGTAYFVAMAATAGPDAWGKFFLLFDKSRFTHVMTLDFVFLTFMAPFWLINDAEQRQWSKGEGLQNTLALLPLVGPVAYLMLRPKLPEEEA